MDARYNLFDVAKATADGTLANLRTTDPLPPDSTSIKLATISDIDFQRLTVDMEQKQASRLGICKVWLCRLHLLICFIAHSLGVWTDHALVRCCPHRHKAPSTQPQIRLYPDGPF